MYDLLYDYFREIVWISTDTTLNDLMDSLSHVSAIIAVAFIVLLFFGFMRRALYWVGSMFGGGYV